MAESVCAVYVGGHGHDEPSPGQRLSRESAVLSVEEPDTEAALARVESGTADCVLVDGSFVEPEGESVVARVREIDSQIPVIVLANGEADPAEVATAAGATDVVTFSSETRPAEYHATRVENAAIRYQCRRGTREEAGAQETDGDAANGSTGGPGPTAVPEQEVFERLFGAIGQSIFATDADGEYTYVNSAGAKITGYEPEELVGEDPELLHPDEADLEKVTAAVDSLLADEDADVVSVETNLETKAGEAVPVEVAITPRFDESGEFGGVVGVVRDVTDERETERRFRELQAIVRAIPDEIVVQDTDGYVERVVPSVGRETTASGYSLEEIQGMHLAELMDDEDLEKSIELITEIITGDRERATQEMQIHTKDDGRIWRESHFTTLEDDDGNIVGSIGVLRDIEERKEYERELERQNERLEEFASLASHDLRNPLNLAQGYMEMVAQACDVEHTEKVTEALDRMEQLIEDTLTWARQGSTVSERRPIRLEKLAPDCWEAVGTDTGTLEVEDDVTVEGDQSRVRQVIENLFRNAVEHGGDDVTVRIGAMDGDGGRRGFYVEDDGAGIPPDERDSVFEAGFTTASGGTGFGLAIIGEIVDAHGWEIAVTESESGGARFEVTGTGRP